MLTNEQAEQYVETIAEQIGEHFDAVQIMVSWNTEGTTRSIERGCGNWYARVGMAHAFIKRDDAEELAHRLGNDGG